MAHRLASTAEADLDGIWLYVARTSGSLEIADRVIDGIAERFYLLSRYPRIGRRRDLDLRVGLRTFPAGDYVIVYRIEDDDVVILHVARNSRDIQTLLRE